MPQQPNVGKQLEALIRQGVGWTIEYSPADDVVTVAVRPPAYPGHYLVREGPTVEPALRQVLIALRVFPAEPPRDGDG